MRPGTYVENIDFLGKAVSVASEEGSAVTTIDGNQSGSVVTFVSKEGEDSIIEGFTITNGSGTYNGSLGFCGGGIFCERSSPTITDNIITWNAVLDIGGGIWCDDNSNPLVRRNSIVFNSTSRHHGGGICCNIDSSPRISDNIISNNTPERDGGGIFCGLNCTPIITNNIIAYNATLTGGGGAIYCGDSSDAVITNNTLVGNYNQSAGGIYCSQARPVVTNTIIWNNGPGPELAGAPLVTYCIVEGGWNGTGNIDADPLFLDPKKNDFHIPFDSPCRSAGDRNALELPDSDFEGDPRTGLFAFPDIGADEFHTRFYVTGNLSNGKPATGVFIGWPQTNPVVLISGAGVLPTPDSTPYGDLWLLPPWDHRVHFNSIPSNGVRLLTRTVNTGLPPSSEIPVQALVGTELSNLFIITIQ